MNPATLPDVLTIEETSAYLRLPVETVLRQASQGKIPGRKIEDHWRFLKVAIDEWLRSQSGQAILLQQVASLADDDSLADLRKTIYEGRGRSEVDENDDLETCEPKNTRIQPPSPLSTFDTV
jgi:excisionase family DNA binding protein